MALNADTRYSTTASQVDAAEIDKGLRKYMLGVYNYMASGLLLSAITAFGTFMYIESAYPTIQEKIVLFSSWQWLLIAISPLVPLFAMNWVGRRSGAGAMSMMYWLFVGLQGVGMSVLAYRYGAGDIAVAFMATAAAFAGLSLFGYTTKKNLSGMGSFLMMGVVGLLVAMIVNMFIGSSTMQFVISFLGVLIFSGLTAFDTQRIKSEYVMYRMQGDQATMSAINGATNLYLNFILIFQFLLSLFGGSDD